MYSTIPQLMYEKAQEIPGADLQFYKDKAGTFFGIKYGDFSELMLDFAAGLLTFGASAGEHIGLISDNRREWLTCSMGIMALGCCDIPRGSEATVKDLAYILRFAGCRIAIVESDYGLKKILECLSELSALERVIMIDPAGRQTGGAETCGIKLFSYDEILNEGKDFRKSNPGKVENILHSGKSSDSATIIFTSGTTGVPKGVELTHENFISQLKSIASMLPLKKGDKALCVLPVWHIYEREMEYYFIYAGISLCYSKPVASMIMADMKKIRPQFMACVPRIWEAIYKALQKQIKSESMGKWMLFSTLTAATITIRKMHDIIFGRTLRFKRQLVTLQILNKVLYIPIFFLIPFKVLGEILFFNAARDFRRAF
ncbi:MAG: AMP-binding protein [Treponema sp.]